MKKLLLILALTSFAPRARAQTPRLTLPVGHVDFVSTTAYSPNGKWVLSSGSGSRVFLWEAASGRLIKIFEEPRFTAVNAWFSPDGRYIAAISIDASQNLAVWEIGTGRAVLRARSLYKKGVYFSSTGHAVYFDDDSIHTVQLATGLHRAYTQAYGGSFSMQGNRLSYIAAVDTLLQLRQIDISSGRLLRNIVVPANKEPALQLAPGSPFRHFEFSPDGKTVLYRTPTLFRLFNTKSGEEMVRFEPGGYLDEGQGFSPDGAFFAYVVPDRGMMRQVPILVADLRRRRLLTFPNNPDTSRWAANDFTFAGIGDSLLFLSQETNATYVNEGRRSTTLIYAMNLHTGLRQE
ncbi:MAG: hypothetical protein EOP50_17460, partial [Sphingobacteriales bacterium]